MTVEELIKKLEKMPQDYIVYSQNKEIPHDIPLVLKVRLHKETTQSRNKGVYLE